MRIGFSDTEKQHIYRAKAILKKLWKTSGISQHEILERLAAQNLETKQSSLSTWLTSKEGNYFRPPEEYLEALLNILCPPEHLEETRDELYILLKYKDGPVTPETLKNKVARQINDNLEETLHDNQIRLKADMANLDLLLEEIEPLIFEYDKGYPVIFVDKGNRKLLVGLLGKDKAVHKQYAVEGGYEVPFKQIQCQDTLIQIINNLNEGIRLVQAYVDRHITEEEDGLLLFDYYLIEDFVSYAWEIADVLLQNNKLCRAVPVLKRTLLKVMTVAWGIRYILENQNRNSTVVQFHNLMKIKGKTHTADIHCSIAVYTGMLARQFVRSPSPERVKKGLQLFDDATKALDEYYPQLPIQHDVFFYKKELANLQYDIANYLLRKTDRDLYKKHDFEQLMTWAYAHYKEIMTTPNVFVDGLSDERAVHVQIFYLLSAAWSASRPSSVVKIINMLEPGRVLNQTYWKIQIARAIAYGILALKSSKSKDRDTYTQAASESLNRSRLVDGFAEKTNQEIESEYVLQVIFGAD